MRISRADRSRLAEWWFTVDRPLLMAILALLGIGLVVLLAASPPVAIRRGFGPYFFVKRQIVFAGAGVLVMLAISLMSPRVVRRFAAGLLAAMVLALAGVEMWGAEINGARRWLSLAGYSLQPSEFAKPAFAVISGWLFAEARRRSDMPALPLAVMLLLLLSTLLVLQPDIGQTLLIALVWGALFFVSGQPMRYAAALSAAGLAAIAAAYVLVDHVQYRVDRFLSPVPGQLTQVERARQSFIEGGFLGRGPGEGTIKSTLPDAHTDFIFAVIAEEYGVIACLSLVLVYGFIVFRALRLAAADSEPQNRLAVVGLALLVGFQALFNMGVNVGLLPAKGITLPLISAGGSSALAMAVTLGMLLALTRRRAAIRPLELQAMSGAAGGRSPPIGGRATP